MSVGRVTAGHFKFSVHVLSEEHTQGILASSGVGSSMLRVNVDDTGRSVLIVSYKYSNLIFSRQIPSVTMKVTSGGSIYKCRTNPKHHKFLRKLATDYLGRLQLFINMFVNNHNFIERELKDANEIEAELMYRKFLIFPLGDKVVLKRKVEGGIQTASIGFDFEDLSFFAEHDNAVTTVETFNEFLITDFLKIDFKDKLQVQYALGHTTREDVLSTEADTIDQLDIRTSINEVYEEATIKNKDKDKLIERLRHVLDPNQETGPNELRHVLGSIFEAVAGLKNTSDKMDWINRDILELIFSILLRNAGNTALIINPIKILRILLSDNMEGCKIFVKRCIMAFESNYEWACIDIYSCVCILMKQTKFREAFLQALGVPRLYEIYIKASFLLLRELKQSASSMGEIYAIPSDTSSPRSDADGFSEVSDFISSDSESESEEESTNDPNPPAINSIGKLAIPKLVIPTQKENPRKRDKDEVEFQRTASEELTALAQNLGETYMTQDLTALSAYLQNDAGVKERKEQRRSVPITYADPSIKHDKGSQRTDSLKNSCYYKIKCSVLKTIARLTIYWEYFDLVANPVNLLFSELLHCHKDNLFTQDSDFRKLIYDVLANYANHVEHIHCYRWKELTRGFTLSRAKGFRQKADKFIWRIHNQLAPAVEAKDFSEIELQLTLLSEYMKYCPSGIVSMQVSNVCMELLLRIKDLAFARGRITATNMDHLPILHSLTDVIDQISTQNEFSSLREVLLSIFVEKKETWRFIKHSSCQVLLSQSLEQAIIGYPRSSEKMALVISYKKQAINHFKICYQLIQEQIKFYISEEKKKVPFAKEARQNVEDYLYNFEFLIHPNRGYLLQILSHSEERGIDPEYKKDILRFLITVFSAEDCVFLKNKAYIDAYVTYSYLSFIKLYHSIFRDQNTLDLIQLHLQLLLAFAQNKNDKIIMKFYQLRVMDFLVREINLEFEITQRNKVTKPLIINNDSNLLDDLNQEEKPKPQIIDHNISETGESSSVHIKEEVSPPKNDNNSSSSTKSKGRRFLPFMSSKKSDPSPKPKRSRWGGSDKHKNDHKNLNLNASADNIVIKRLNDQPISSSSSALSDNNIEKESSEQIKIDTINNNNEKSNDELKVNNGEELTEEIEEGEEEEEYEESEEETEEYEESGEYETDEDSEEDSEEESETTSPKKPFIPSLTGVPQKSAPLSSSSGGGGGIPKLSLGQDLIKGGVPNTTSKNESKNSKKASGIPKLSLAQDMIKGGTSSSESNNNTGSIPKLSLDQEMIKGGKSTMYDNDQTTGILSNLEKKIDKNDPKWQLVFDNKKKEGEQENEEELSQTDIQEINRLYRKERKERKLYVDQRVHITALQLIFSLLLTPCDTMEPLYSDQFPLDNKKLNIPFLLRYHFSHSANSLLVPPLVAATQKMGRAPFRLLKLLCVELFRKDDYTELKRLAIGAYGTVYRCRLKPEYQATNVAIKLMEVPKGIHDRCVVHDIFDEVLVLDKFKDDNRISHTFDFGTDDDYYWITMKKYKCSLKQWRKEQKAPLQKNLALYLNIYMNVLNCFQFLTENRVNHFDVKCDNFLIQPLNEENWTVQDEENFWNPVSDVPNFSVCLADFGEAKVYDKEIDGYTTRNRGTEFTKSPEMLAVAYASQKTRATYDRRKQVGASSPSDVWSLGCLLYELLTGEFLFYDQDWVRFFIRVTSLGQELITPEKIEKIDNNQILVEFLRFVLNRDPVRRPSIHDVIQRFKYVRGRLTSSSKVHSPRFPTPRDSDIISPDDPLISKSLSPNPSLDSKTTPTSLSLTHTNNDNITAQSDKSTKDKLSPTATNLDKESEQEQTLAHSISQQTLTIPDEFRKQRASLHRPGMEYFLENISEVTDYLYIGPVYEVSKRDVLKKLRITHMINCTAADSFYPTEFFTFHLPLSTKSPEPLGTSIDALVSFINEARFHNGKVLVYSDEAISRSPAVVIAYLMATRNWTYFEAMIFVKDCRYVVDLDESFVKILCNYHREKQRSCSKQYQCLCGACTITVSDPFNQSYFPNPFPCSCCLEDEPTKCPNVGCKEYIGEMKRLFQYSAKEVLWGYTNHTNIIGDLSRSTRPYVQAKELCIAQPSSVVEKSWTVYKCRTCDFITHALRKKNAPPDEVNSNFDVAVVTSIAVS